MTTRTTIWQDDMYDCAECLDALAKIRTTWLLGERGKEIKHSVSSLRDHEDVRYNLLAKELWGVYVMALQVVEKAECLIRDDHWLVPTMSEGEKKHVMLTCEYLAKHTYQNSTQIAVLSGMDEGVNDLPRANLERLQRVAMTAFTTVNPVPALIFI